MDAGFKRHGHRVVGPRGRRHDHGGALDPVHAHPKLGAALALVAARAHREPRRRGGQLRLADGGRLAHEGDRFATLRERVINDLDASGQQELRAAQIALVDGSGVHEGDLVDDQVAVAGRLVEVVREAQVDLVHAGHQVGDDGVVDKASRLDLREQPLHAVEGDFHLGPALAFLAARPHHHAADLGQELDGRAGGDARVEHERVGVAGRRIGHRAEAGGVLDALALEALDGAHVHAVADDRVGVCLRAGRGQGDREQGAAKTVRVEGGQATNGFG